MTFDDRNSKVDVSSAFRFDAPPDALTTIGGKSYVYFSGDGYLGLQAEPKMIEASCLAALKYGLSAATSRSCFTAAPIQDVERSAATFFGSQCAFYTLDEKNAAELLLSVLSNRFERAFVDEISAPFWKMVFCRMSSDAACVRRSDVFKKDLISFNHCDANDLQKKIDEELELGERPLLLTDGVFANWGDVAPLKQYEEVLKRYGNSAILVDDSHGIGVLGDRCRGTLEHFGFDFSKVNQTGNEIRFDESAPLFDDEFDSADNNDQANNSKLLDSEKSDGVNVFMFASLAKAIGGFGCVVIGSELFVDDLTECDRSFAVPPNSVAAATSYALQLLTRSNERRLKLQENVQRLRLGLRKLGFDVGDSPTPIVPLQVGSIQNMKRIQKELEKNRVLVSFLPCRFHNAMGILRLTVFSTHTTETIQMLLSSLENSLQIGNDYD